MPLHSFGIVGGGDDRAAVEVLAGDVEVQHVRPDDPDVGDLRPLAARALDEPAAISGEDRRTSRPTAIRRAPR